MELGELSAQYESNGNPGTVSSGCGDYGGASYGKYQFSSAYGVVQDFVEWLKKQSDPWANYGRVLNDSGDYNSEGFIEKWREIGEIDPDSFGKLQHDYTKEVYFDTAAEELRSELGFDIEDESAHSNTLRQVLWSRSVQYGSGNMIELFELACELAVNDINSIDDFALIYYIYEVCSTNKEWCQGSADIKEGLRNRFKNEREQALLMLEEENTVY